MALDILMQEAKGLSEEALMEVVRFVRFMKTENLHTEASAGAIDNAPRKKVRSAGMYKGQIWMAEDFDAPMDEGLTLITADENIPKYDVKTYWKQ